MFGVMEGVWEGGSIMGGGAAGDCCSIEVIVISKGYIMVTNSDCVIKT